MNEKEIIKRAVDSKNAILMGLETPASVKKVIKHKDGTIELKKVPQDVVEKATLLLRSRKRLELKQTEFSKLLGIPVSTYRKYENYNLKTPEHVLKLAIMAERHHEELASLQIA